MGPNHLENQDSYIVDERNLLFAVADGVGGYSGAKEASSIAVQMLAKSASLIIDEKSLADSIMEIHERIIKRSRYLRFPNMGTTLAVAKIFPREGRVIIGNVGDSPILLFRGNSMESIYVDDSHRSYDPLSMYGIIQYLGLEQKLDIHTQTFSDTSGDTLLLCSDGITDNLLNSSEGKEKLVSLVKLGSAEKIVDSALDVRIKARRHDCSYGILNFSIVCETSFFESEVNSKTPRNLIPFTSNGSQYPVVLPHLIKRKFFLRKPFQSALITFPQGPREFGRGKHFGNPVRFFLAVSKEEFERSHSHWMSDCQTSLLIDFADSSLFRALAQF